MFLHLSRTTPTHPYRFIGSLVCKSQDYSKDLDFFVSYFVNDLGPLHHHISPDNIRHDFTLFGYLTVPLFAICGGHTPYHHRVRTLGLLNPPILPSYGTRVLKVQSNPLYHSEAESFINFLIYPYQHVRNEGR